MAHNDNYPSWWYKCHEMLKLNSFGFVSLKMAIEIYSDPVDDSFAICIDRKYRKAILYRGTEIKSILSKRFLWKWNLFAWTGS